MAPATEIGKLLSTRHLALLRFGQNNLLRLDTRRIALLFLCRLGIFLADAARSKEPISISDVSGVADFFVNWYGPWAAKFPLVIEILLAGIAFKLLVKLQKSAWNRLFPRDKNNRA